MQGWFFTNTGEPLELGELDEPTPGPGEALLEIKAAGLCHSDVGMLTDESWLQTLAFRPIVIGHEVAGVVTAIGDGVTEVQVGDRVGVCPTATGGAPGYARHGGFTYQHVAPAADLVPMPEGLSFELAALGTDAGMTSYHAIVARGGLQPGMKVGVIGLGGLGQIGARVGVVKGAEVHVAEPNEKAWPLAKEIGAATVVKDASEWEGQGFDLIVDYAGFGTTTRAATKAVRRDGRVVLVGMGKLEFTLDTMDMILSEVTVSGSQGGTRQDIAEVYELLASGAVRPTVTTIGFDDIPQGIDDLKNHRITGRLVAHIAD
ncbi:MAG: zinc-binding dehydrogenase [Actinomycetota bacterium]